MTSNREKAEKVLEKYMSAPKWFRHKRAQKRGRVEPVDTVWLYFIEMQVADRPIKIGVAKDVQARLLNLRVSSPFEIAVLAKVEVFRIVEKELHAALACSRIRGEWYRRSAVVETALAAALAGDLKAFLEPVAEAA